MDFHWILEEGFTGFFLPSLLDVSLKKFGVQLSFHGFEWPWVDGNDFYLVLPSFRGFCWVSMGFTELLFETTSGVHRISMERVGEWKTELGIGPLKCGWKRPRWLVVDQTLFGLVGFCFFVCFASKFSHGPPTTAIAGDDGRKNKTKNKTNKTNERRNLMK